MTLGHGEADNQKESEMNPDYDQDGAPGKTPVPAHFLLSGKFARSRRAPAERTASKARKTVS